MSGNRQSADYYTLTEAARILGVHYETAARWVRAGKLQGAKVSRKKVLVSRKSCDALLKASGESDVGAPHRWLRFVGLLSQEEADQILNSIQESRQS